ncbi:hypothetical protein Ancab_012756 [Ancistrocladus abbreviatus]
MLNGRYGASKGHSTTELLPTPPVLGSSNAGNLTSIIYPAIVCGTRGSEIPRLRGEKGRMLDGRVRELAMMTAIIRVFSTSSSSYGNRKCNGKLQQWGR